VVPGSPQFDAMQDAQQGKTMAILSYIIFFIPLLMGAHKTSPFVKYHANQGTVLGLSAIAYSILSSILSAVIKVPSSYWGITVYHTPAWLGAVLWIISLAFFALCIMGIINVVNARVKPLPVIGTITIIK